MPGNGQPNAQRFSRAEQEGIVLALALMQGQYITPDSWLQQPTDTGMGLRPYISPGGDVGGSVLGTIGQSMSQPLSIRDRALRARPDIASGFLQDIQGMSDSELSYRADSMLRAANANDPATTGQILAPQLAQQAKQTATMLPPPIDRSNDLRVPPAQSVQYLSTVQEAAKRNGVDPTLLAAMIDWESGWDPKARGAAGEIGLGQLMPATARSLGVTDATNPQQNIEGAARYLGEQLRANGGDESLALGHYNAGPGGTPVQHYVDSVLSQRGKYANMSSYVPLGDKSGANAPNLELGRLSNDMTTLLTMPTSGKSADLMDYINRVTSTVLPQIQEKATSPNEEDRRWAKDMKDAYDGAMIMAVKRVDLSQKLGEDGSANAIAMMRYNLERSSLFQRAASDAAKLDFEYYSFDSSQRFNLMKYDTVDVPAMRWKQAVDLIDMAHQEMVEQHRMVEGEYNADEGTRRFEVGRQDAAKKYIQDAEQAYVGFLTGNAKAIEAAAKTAGDQYLTYLPYIITESMKGKPFPGYEPGGAQEQLAKALGTKFTPNNYGDQGLVNVPDPYQAVDDLKTRLGGLEQSFPRPQMSDVYTPSTPTQFNYDRQAAPYTPSPLVSSLMGGGPDAIMPGSQPPPYDMSTTEDTGSRPSIYDILGPYEVPQGEDPSNQEQYQ